ncbi:MAG: spore maturation protein, partial [Candidatus Firestonebacteria bacterium]
GQLFRALNVPLEIFMLAIIKPLSGSAATGVFTNIVKTAGPDSLAAVMAAIIIGSAETTFYVISIYLGAVGIKKTRYLVAVCLIADFIGIIVSIVIAQAVYKYL